MCWGIYFVFSLTGNYGEIRYDVYEVAKMSFGIKFAFGFLNIN